MSKSSRAFGLVLVLGLALTAVAFMIFLLDDVARRGLEPVILGLLGMIGMGALMFRGPVGKAIAAMLEGGDRGDDHVLAARVADLEDRLAEISLETQRFLEIEERLEFTERLLAQQSDSAPRGDAA